MHRAIIDVVNLTPMLMNPMGDVVLEGLRTGVFAKLARDVSRREAARRNIYLHEGHMGIPTQNLLSSLVIAGRHVKVGKKAVSTLKDTILFDFFALNGASDGNGGVLFSGEFIPFTNIEGQGTYDFSNAEENDNNPDLNGWDGWHTAWHDDVRRGTNPKDGVAVAITRPKFNDWAFQVVAEFDDTKVSQNTIDELF